ncbi:MAG: hypothetical protein WBY94_27055 [Polyangiaceae bacterium]
MGSHVMPAHALGQRLQGQNRQRGGGDRAHRRRSHDVARVHARVGVRRKVHRVLHVDPRLGEGRAEGAAEGVKVDRQRGLGLEVERVARIGRELGAAL